MEEVGRNVVLVSYGIYPLGHSGDAWWCVAALPPRGGDGRWILLERCLGGPGAHRGSEGPPRAPEGHFLQPWTDAGYDLVREDEPVVRQASALPWPLVIRGRGEWLGFLRSSCKRVVAVTPVINAGERRSRSCPPMFLTLKASPDGKWMYEAREFGDIGLPTRAYERARRLAVASLKSDGFDVIQIPVRDAYALVGTWDGGTAPTYSAWEYPFISWDEYGGTHPPSAVCGYLRPLLKHPPSVLPWPVGAPQIA
jgi:hypothetical protein